MISFVSTRNRYNDFYVEMRKYIWGPEVVELLADIEVECYKSFPNLSSLKSMIGKLKSIIREDMMHSEDLRHAVNQLYDCVTEGRNVYMPLVES